MLRAIFTLDYEIHGNGEGDPRALMVKPTDRLLRMFEAFGAKVTIMADVAEILRFREHAERSGRDDFHFESVKGQLQRAIARGHDVQLHLHSSYFDARLEGRRWVQDWSNYDFASLPLQRMDLMLRGGKQFLESLLQPVRPDYRCDVFRAANWSVSPSTNVVRALLDNGIRIDTSVFKHGRRSGRVNFDYSSASSALVPWRVKASDICARDDNGELWEFPIYAESRCIAAFATAQRLYRGVLGRMHRVVGGVPDTSTKGNPAAAKRAGLWRRASAHHAWKADFNQCSGRQLIGAIERADAEFGSPETALPFVLIGHSKLFSRFNEWSLRPFLAHIDGHRGRFGFGTFADFPVRHGWEPAPVRRSFESTPSTSRDHEVRERRLGAEADGA